MVNDVELLENRLYELKEITARLTHMHQVMVDTLKDISKQSRESSEKALAKACLERLELND